METEKSKTRWWRWLLVSGLCLFVGGLLFLTVWGNGRTHCPQYLSDIKILETACEAYKGDYGKWPLTTNLITNNSDLIYTLIASNAGANANATLNPEARIFLILPNLKDRFFPAKGGFLDSWGNPYHVILVASNQVTIWSSGPNGKDESGKGDDITSWR